MKTFEGDKRNRKKIPVDSANGIPECDKEEILNLLMTDQTHLISDHYIHILEKMVEAEDQEGTQTQQKRSKSNFST